MVRLRKITGLRKPYRLGRVVTVFVVQSEDRILPRTLPPRTYSRWVIRHTFTETLSMLFWAFYVNAADCGSFCDPRVTERTLFDLS